MFFCLNTCLEMFPSPSTSNCLKAPRTSSIVLHRPRNLAIIAPGLTPANISYLKCFHSFVTDQQRENIEKMIMIDAIISGIYVSYFLILRKICLKIQIKLVPCQLNYFSRLKYQLMHFATY